MPYMVGAKTILSSPLYLIVGLDEYVGGTNRTSDSDSCFATVGPAADVESDAAESKCVIGYSESVNHGFFGGIAVAIACSCGSVSPVLAVHPVTASSPISTPIVATDINFLPVARPIEVSRCLRLLSSEPSGFLRISFVSE